MSSTALSNLVNVRYYSPSDPYHYSVDNRPLTDLNTNITVLASLLDGISAGNVFYIEDASTTVNSLESTTNLLPNTGPYDAGQLITVRVNNTNTGAVTFTANAGAAYPVHGMAGALQGGELVAGKHYLLSWEDSDGVWELVGSSKGNLQVAAAVQSAQAVNLGQITEGTLDVSFNSIETGSLTVTDSLEVTGSTTLGQTTVPNATSGSNPINLSQLFIGNRKAVFTANGSWTVPEGVTVIWVSGSGGGGGGGGGNQLASNLQGAGGGGGYAGEIAIKVPINVTPSDVLSIEIGPGGKGGAGVGSLSNAGDGSSGGETILSTGTSALLTLSGGSFGSGAVQYATSYVFGGYGFTTGRCEVAVNASNGTAGQVAVGGAGQPTPFGLPGLGSITSPDGGNGSNGSGGGGGGSAYGGGNGGNGILIIEW